MASKAEKRLARKAIKLEKDIAKNARQFEEPRVQREIAQLREPALRKKVSEPKVPPYDTLITWDRRMEDTGNWSWGQCRNCPEDAWAGHVGPFLGECAKKSWRELDAERTGKGQGKRRRKHCFYEFDKLIDEAYLRLIELELDDFAPSIFRFRLSGKRRLYGFRMALEFLTLWWDPEHQLYRGRG